MSTLNLLIELSGEALAPLGTDPVAKGHEIDQDVHQRTDFVAVLARLVRHHASTYLLCVDYLRVELISQFVVAVVGGCINHAEVLAYTVMRADDVVNLLSRRHRPDQAVSKCGKELIASASSHTAKVSTLTHRA